MWNKLAEAIAFAALAHKDQMRKYTLAPYIVHPMEVMQIVLSNANIVSEDQLCAAVLHDVVEDCGVTRQQIEERFGDNVARLVIELTEVPVPGNRATRKAAEVVRLSQVSEEAQDIKLADLISNTRDIVANDPNFARIYLREKRALLEVLTKGDEKLYRMAMEAVIDGELKLIGDPS